MHSLLATVCWLVWLNSSQRHRIFEFPREIHTEIFKVVSGDREGQIQLKAMQLPRAFCSELVVMITIWAVAPACWIHQPFIFFSTDKLTDSKILLPAIYRSYSSQVLLPFDLLLPVNQVIIDSNIRGKLGESIESITGIKISENISVLQCFVVVWLRFKCCTLY